MGGTEADTLPLQNAAKRRRYRLAATEGLFRVLGSRGGRFSPILVLAILGTLIAPAPARAQRCKLQKIAELPITMAGMRPLMTASINHVDVQFVVDSGAFYSMMSAGSAAALKLRTSPAPAGFYVIGARGTAEASIATVQTFSLAGAALHNVEFLVGGSEAGQGSAGLLGQNFLHIADVEYDLGQGMVRLMKPDDCGKTMLAYLGQRLHTVLRDLYRIGAPAEWP
jgi:hypothetical protein